ncbi:MAG: AmpG family muropeptide MFS transporter [Alcanivorax nanhaiticus]
MPSQSASWQQSLKAFLHPRVVTMFFYGFSAGIPLLLIFSSLSLWLREAGVDRSTVTYFSWAALAYSFKFLWAPLIDRLPVPVLTRLMGRRRAWMLVAQLAVGLSIFAIARVNPGEPGALTMMAVAVVLLGFTAATQDIVIDAYRIESASVDLQAMMSSTYIVGYRIGMLVSGAGSLLLASFLGSNSETYNYDAWHITYSMMALTMLVGIITTLIIREPESHRPSPYKYSGQQYLKFVTIFALSMSALVASYLLGADLAAETRASLTELFNNGALAGLVVETTRLLSGIICMAAVVLILSVTPLYERELVQESYIDPVLDFFRRYGKSLALILLVFIGFYRISDIVLGAISNVFFEDMGFTKVEIATVVKTFGLFMTIAGGLLGGVLSVRYGTTKTLFLGAFLTVATNLLFMWQAYAGHDIRILYIVISADNLSAGVASAAFVAFLSRLTNISFTAMQYAIFSSLMTLLPKTIGGYSGSMVDNLGYPGFFLLASLMGVPVLGLIYLIQRKGTFRE